MQPSSDGIGMVIIFFLLSVFSGVLGWLWMSYASLAGQIERLSRVLFELRELTRQAEAGIPQQDEDGEGE